MEEILTPSMVDDLYVTVAQKRRSPVPNSTKTVAPTTHTAASMAKTVSHDSPPLASSSTPVRCTPTMPARVPAVLAKLL
jgi:hypothetical protein